MGVKIVDFLKQTRKATDMKSLRINYWEINQVTPKFQMSKKRSKTEKKNITIEFYIFEIV